MTWTPCTAPIVADVIRWTEAIWSIPTSRRKKVERVGEQTVTAEVLELGDYVRLQVRAIENISVPNGDKYIQLKTGDIIKRKKSTIDRGKTERLLWSDEGARKSVLHP
jgi:hypothetical protein